MAIDWTDYPVPPMRHRALHGERIVRCFEGRPPSVAAMFARSVAQHGGADAVVCAGRRWSYAQADAEAARIAAGLAAQACAPASVC